MEMETGRIVEDYELSRKIGSGTFSVVWLATDRKLGSKVAVKEIEKKHLTPKLKDCLLKEISILRTIVHPNIIRFYDSIETPDKIYIVLEYCSGGDLVDYINRHGKVPHDVARHFMRQLAAGLQALQEKNLIHRDLKPQNLLLSTKDVITPMLKIGDFGFARSVKPENLADTICGSPLYMAPEIIQNQKYNAKADLWSVGAILYQLVTGKPPFDGKNRMDLFKNVLKGTELKFPQGIHPDCVELCKSLLRQNPIERLSFREFFTHKFLQELSPYRFKSRTDIQRQRLSNQSRVFDSLELIERENILLNGLKGPSNSIDTTLHDPLQSFLHRRNNRPASTGAKSPLSGQGPAYPYQLTTMERSFIVHPSATLQLLLKYCQELTEIAFEMSKAEKIKESFSVELVVLALWKKALDLCDSWIMSSPPMYPSEREVNLATSLNFSSPLSAKHRASQEFVIACNQAENTSTQLNEKTSAPMPDGIETIFEQALAYGSIGGVEESLNNKTKAVTLYNKSILLLTFIAEEAPTLHVNPPFSLTPEDKKRILYYISSLKQHLQKI